MVTGYVNEDEVREILGSTNGSCDDSEDVSCDTKEEVCTIYPIARTKIFMDFVKILSLKMSYT